MATERITIKLPPGFNPDRHQNALLVKVGEAHGDGWEIESIDPAAGVAFVTRQAAIIEVSAQAGAHSFDIRLARGTKPSDGDKIASKLADAHPGYVMSAFDPFLGKATLTKMDDATIRCRGAVAGVLGAKPWEVQCRMRKDGGFDLELTTKYVPSKHDEKLDEVAVAIVGRPGWYVITDPNTLTASIVPALPPTFPPAIPFPMKSLGRADRDRTPFGWQLPRPGESVARPAEIDWKQSAFAMVAGLPGAGKAQPLDSRIPVPVSARFPSGWAELGELQIGDEVFTHRGMVTRIDYLSPVTEREAYRVELSDGQVVEADGKHLWRATRRTARYALSLRPARTARLAEKVSALRRTAQQYASVGAGCREIAELAGIKQETARSFIKASGISPVALIGGKTKIFPAGEVLSLWAEHVSEAGLVRRKQLESNVTTKEMAASLRVQDGRLNWSIPLAGCLELPPAQLPIDPYLLGAWLGDGTSRTGGITVGSADLTEMRSLLETVRPVTRVETKSGTDAVVLHFGRLNSGQCVRGHDNWHDPGSYAPLCLDCRAEGHSSKRINQSLTEDLRDLGVLRNKHIPAAYLRASPDQRRALLAGLVDTDGSIGATGQCEIALCDETLIEGVLELVRSLGMRARITQGPAAITELGAEGQKVRRVVGIRWRLKFMPHEFTPRLARKAAQITRTRTVRSERLYVQSISRAGTKSMRCLRVEAPEHTYLTGGFVPTHNTVLLNSIITGAVAGGSELAVVDLPAKRVDFIWCKDFVRPGGWGCESDAAAVTTLSLVYEEGERRSRILAESGVVNWTELPPDRQFKPILVVVDEVSALLVPRKIPPGLPKEHPLRVEAMDENILKAALDRLINKIVAEMRFVGIRMILSSQVANNSTGIGPSLKGKIGHKVLAGSNPSKTARSQSFNDESCVPGVPDWVRSDSQIVKGTGSAELDGSERFVFKSFYASTDAYAAGLDSVGAPRTDRPEPTANELAEFTDSLRTDGAGDDPAPRKTHGSPQREMSNTGLGSEWMGHPDGDGQVSGYAKANAARHALGGS